MKRVFIAAAMVMSAFSGPSFALSDVDVATAKAKIDNVNQADAVVSVNAATVAGINIRVVGVTPPRGPARADAPASADVDVGVVTVTPSDAEFAAVLAAVKVVAARRKIAETSALQALGVSVTPKP